MTENTMELFFINNQTTFPEQKQFYQTVLKDTNPTHFLLLFHDSGFIGHGNRLNKLLRQ